jgi:hypothetical protein
MGRRRAEHVVIRHRHNGLFISVTIDNQRRNGEGLIGWPRQNRNNGCCRQILQEIQVNELHREYYPYTSCTTF